MNNMLDKIPNKQDPPSAYRYWKTMLKQSQRQLNFKHLLVWSSLFSGWNSNTSMTMQICEEQIWNANRIVVGRMFVKQWPNTTVTIEIYEIWITASSRGFHISGYPRHSFMYNSILFLVFIYHCINVYDINLTYNGQPSHFH